MRASKHPTPQRHLCNPAIAAIERDIENVVLTVSTCSSALASHTASEYGLTPTSYSAILQTHLRTPTDLLYATDAAALTCRRWLTSTEHRTGRLQRLSTFLRRGMAWQARLKSAQARLDALQRSLRREVDADTAQRRRSTANGQLACLPPDLLAMVYDCLSGNVADLGHLPATCKSIYSAQGSDVDFMRRLARQAFPPEGSHKSGPCTRKRACMAVGIPSFVNRLSGMDGAVFSKMAELVMQGAMERFIKQCIDAQMVVARMRLFQDNYAAVMSRASYDRRNRRYEVDQAYIANQCALHEAWPIVVAVYDMATELFPKHDLRSFPSTREITSDSELDSWTTFLEGVAWIEEMTKVEVAREARWARTRRFEDRTGRALAFQHQVSTSTAPGTWKA